MWRRGSPRGLGVRGRNVMSASVAAGVLPRLDAFDQEFECEPADSVKDVHPRTGFRLSTLMLLALIAGVISAVALAWSNSTATQSDATAEEVSSEKPEATINRLAREVDALRKEVRQLSLAQRQAAATIAALQSAEQELRGVSTTWYSDPSALTYGLAAQADAGLGLPTSRRSAIVRNRTRDIQRRDDGAPLSLEPPQ
jgi:TolA-binding protein